jgi:hypothetical protein
VRSRPRIAVKSIDSKRALIGFTKRRSPDQEDLIPEGATDGKPDPGYTFPGHFLDLKTLAFAQTNESHTLDSACEAFRVEHGKLVVEEHGRITPEYIDYARRDVLATAELLEKLLAEFNWHPIDLAPTKAFSPASVGKAYYRALGIAPVLQRQPDFPLEFCGYAMAAYYGGRAEAHIRKQLVPVVYLDFLSMYPTVNALMGLWELVTAQELQVVDVTDEVQELLASVSPDRCFEPSFWRQLLVIVQLQPTDDILPVRARYGETDAWQIGLNHCESNEPFLYTLADCIASTLLRGEPPQVLRALRLVPSGTPLPTLRSLDLRKAVPVDPAQDDFFRKVIELRKSLPSELSSAEREQLGGFLKVLANSTSYGVFAEMNRQEAGSKQREQVEVYGVDGEPFVCSVTAPEEPGKYCFPPFAAFIAGAARLMLSLLERCVTDLGGTYAMGDTDSMAIVATEQGGWVPCPGGPQRSRRKPAIHALSWDEVDAIIARFAALNPYDSRAIPGSVLKLEDVNRDMEGERQQVWCYAISAKRYALFTRSEYGTPEIVKYSEHGLGHLLNPTDPDSEDRAWMREVWEGIVRVALGLPVEEPGWLDRPALSRLSISSPKLLHPFQAFNRGKDFADQVKPFNFLLSAHVHSFGHPDGVDPKTFHLMAPYERDPRKWTRLPWVNRGSRARVRITTTGETGGPGVARVKTYRDVIDEFQHHPEAKAADSLGNACQRGTVGLLQRRHVRLGRLVQVGKESNRLEEVEAGLAHDPDEVWTEFADPKRVPWATEVLPALKRMRLANLAAATGLSERQLRAIRNGRAMPRPHHRLVLCRLATAFSGSE